MVLNTLVSNLMINLFCFIDIRKTPASVIYENLKIQK